LFSFLLVGSFASAADVFGHLEFRVGLGQQSSNPEAFNDYMETVFPSNPDIKSIKSNSIDLGYRFDSMSMLFGIRYDIFQFNTSDTIRLNGAWVTMDTKLDGNRVNLLADWRFYQSDKGYGGLLVYIPVVQKLKYTTSTSNATTGVTSSQNYNGTLETGFGAGIEGGITIQKRYTLGAEVGYNSLLAKKFENDSDAEILDSNGKSPEMDLSAVYFRVAIGFTFF
jgi:hypothetical protein